MPSAEPSLTLHTLGPEGTNCAEAARHWLSLGADSGAPPRGDVVLHRTLEDAAAAMTDPHSERLISCAAYPDLHTFIFSRLDRLTMTDAFVMPTHSMVVARRYNDGTATPSTGTVASHPAPRQLVPLNSPNTTLDRSYPGDEPTIVWATSNADAAVRCAGGETDACITTRAAAKIHSLAIERDYGPVPMAFLVHALRS